MNTKPTNTLKLRAHSVRNLTAAELRGVVGGFASAPLSLINCGTRSGSR